jgi:5'-methylthioadenosine phosphorylase
VKIEIGLLSEIDLALPLGKAHKFRVGTPYGPSSTIRAGEIKGKTVAFLPRSGDEFNIPPHKINYLANIWAFRQLGIERIIAVDCVMAISEEIKLGELVVPEDVIDFTKSRKSTFYDESPLIRVELMVPYCPEIRFVLSKSIEEVGKSTWKGIVYACIEGPRYATKAEMAVYRELGCSIIGTASIPEAPLARELEICYSPLCLVVKNTSGQSLTPDIMGKLKEVCKEVLTRAIEKMPERKCECTMALEKARSEALRFV